MVTHRAHVTALVVRATLALALLAALGASSVAGREDATGSVRPPASGRLPQLFSRSVAQAHGPPQDLYAVPIGGADPRPLARLEADEPVAAWSPDGAHLAVLSVESLSIMPAAGGAGTIVLAPGAYGSVDWTK